MATNWQTYPISYRGGLMTHLGLLDHGTQFPGSARKMINFEASFGGGYSKVLGYQKWSPEPVPGLITSPIFGSILLDPATAIAVRGDKIYRATRGDVGGWSDIFTLDAPAFHRVRHATYDFGQGPQIVMVDGSNAPYYYDLTLNTVSQPTLDATAEDIEGASFVAVFANRLFFAKDASVYYSNLLTDTNFDPALGAGVFKVESDVTGLIVFRDQLIIFSEDRIDYLTGTSEQDFKVDSITRKTGCPWPDTIQEVGGDILYKGPDGVRYLSATQKNDDFALERASENIQVEVAEVYVEEANAVSLVIRNKAQYRLFYYNRDLEPNGQQGFVASRFADQTSDDIAWGLLQGFKVYTTDSKQFGAEEVVIFSDGLSDIYQMEWGYSFDGQNIDCVFETPFIFFEDPRVRKTFYKHHLYIKNLGIYSFNTKLTLDFKNNDIVQPPQQSFSLGNGTISIYGTAVYGVSSYSTPKRASLSENLVGSGFSASLTYSDSSTNPSFTISSAVIEFSYNDRK